MAPPSGVEFQETYHAVRQILMKPSSLVNRAMEYADLSKLHAVGWQPLVRGGLRGIELFGFFVVGEMIGRRSLKGYKV
jgi:Mitochondrial ATP synthase g subunit